MTDSEILDWVGENVLEIFSTSLFRYTIRYFTEDGNTAEQDGLNLRDCVLKINEVDHV